MEPKVKAHLKYTYAKEGVYYFCRVIPKDLEPYYSRLRFVKSLRTESSTRASFAAKHIASKLEDHYHSKAEVGLRPNVTKGARVLRWRSLV
jgi:hypothetical protein